MYPGDEHVDFTKSLLTRTKAHLWTTYIAEITGS